MKNSSEDDRGYPRKEICLGVLFKHGMEWFPADIKDVTVGGVSFIASEKFDPGTEINIFFGDNHDIGNNDVRTVVLRCRVLESYSPPKYLVAVKLVGANEKYAQDVLAYLERENPGVG